MSNLRWADLLFWLFHREVDRYPQLDANGFPDVGEMVVLWERGDIYGLPPEEAEVLEEEEEAPLSEEVAP